MRRFSNSWVGRLTLGAARFGILLIVLSVILFYVLHAMPSSAEAVSLAADPSRDAATLERLSRERGLDRPIHERYLCWLFGSHGDGCEYWPSEGILFGDLGYSRAHQRPVSEIIGDRLENTLSLMVPALLLALILSVLVGVVQALEAGRPLDRALGMVTFASVSMPVHWLGLLGLWLGAVLLGWFPSGGNNDPKDPSFLSAIHHAMMPVSVLALLFLGRWSRFVRASLLEVMHLDYVQTARAKGLSEKRVIVRHALANALIPLIAVVGQSMPALFSGALVTEKIFSYPGMGVLIFESLEADDYLVAMAIFLGFAVVTMVATLLTDLAYGLADPRIRREARL